MRADLRGDVVSVRRIYGEPPGVQPGCANRFASSPKAARLAQRPAATRSSTSLYASIGTRERTRALESAVGVRGARREKPVGGAPPPRLPGEGQAPRLPPPST